MSAFSLALLAALGTANAAGETLSAVVTTVTSTETPLIFKTALSVSGTATSTGVQPFLIQADPIWPSAGESYVPPSPLQTREPISGRLDNVSIFHLMGSLSPYHSAPSFGVAEYPMPDGASIVWLNTLHNQGSNYPGGNPVPNAIVGARNNGASFTGDLEFLNSYKNITFDSALTSYGRQECYDSGVQHRYLYGGLFNPNSSTKLVARTINQTSMKESAENFLAGFAGLEYGEHFSIGSIIDEPGYNNSLAGYNACNQSYAFNQTIGWDALSQWVFSYTTDTIDRLNKMSTGFVWTANYVYSAQELCAYETVALGYSQFCDLFTYREWQSFEQSFDIQFWAYTGFGSPTGRAVGVGYVREVLERINRYVATAAAGSANMTEDTKNTTFPVDQILNFDFSTDYNIFAVLTAFGLTQFSPIVSNTTFSANHSVNIGNITPFGGRLDIEIINSTKVIPPMRSPTSVANGTVPVVPHANTTVVQYIAFKLNQRTLPLHDSYDECETRDDGWCELQTWQDAVSTQVKSTLRNYDNACYGDYEIPPYGDVQDGMWSSTSASTPSPTVSPTSTPTSTSTSSSTSSSASSGASSEASSAASSATSDSTGTPPSKPTASSGAKSRSTPLSKSGTKPATKSTIVVTSTRTSSSTSTAGPTSYTTSNSSATTA